MTEKEMAEGCRRHDNEARRALYEHFAGMLLSLLCRYLTDRAEAEDLLHDGFIKVFTVIDRFTYRGEGSLKGWLCRLFTNEAINRLRARPEAADEDVDALPDDIADEDPDPRGRLSTDDIMALIAELPQGYRVVLNLFLVEGWSHRDIAERLGIKESTSASQYLRARALLRKKITERLETT